MYCSHEDRTLFAFLMLHINSFFNSANTEQLLPSGHCAGGGGVGHGTGGEHTVEMEISAQWK